MKMVYAMIGYVNRKFKLRNARTYECKKLPPKTRECIGVYCGMERFRCIALAMTT